MSRYLPILGGVLVIVVAVALYFLTFHDSQEDPCAYPQSDLSGAILAEDPDDGDALANRAMLQRGACKPRPTPESQ